MAVTTPLARPAAATRGSRLRQWQRDLTGLAFLSPWILGFLLLTLFPMVQSLWIAFTSYDLLTPPKWVGLENFQRMATDPRFLKALSVTVRYVVLSVPLKLVTALAIAMLLAQKIRGIGLYRVIYYIPSLVGSSVAVAIMWRRIFSRDGLVNNLLRLVGIQGPDWIAHPSFALYTLAGLSAWQFGSSMVIFLAGLKQIPAELYEASAIDGAGRWQQFWRITIPMLSPVIFFNLVMQTIGAFQVFTQGFLITRGGLPGVPDPGAHGEGAGAAAHHRPGHLRDRGTGWLQEPRLLRAAVQGVRRRYAQRGAAGASGGLAVRIAIVTDEIDPDVEQAIACGLEWGIRDFEIRGVGPERVPDLDQEEVQRLETLRDRYGVAFTALSPGTFKCGVTDPRADADLQQRLPRTFDLAQRLGVTRVITFGFARQPGDPPDAWNRVVDYLARAAHLAEAWGVVLCLEPEAGFWCGSGARAAAAVRAVGSPALRVNWDPGNAAADGERAFPDGYEAVRGLVANVHIKDYRPAPGGGRGEWVAPGDGVIDWAGQFAALLADRPVEWVTVETHFHPRVAGSRLCVERVRRYLAQAQGERAGPPA